MRTRSGWMLVLGLLLSACSQEPSVSPASTTAGSSLQAQATTPTATFSTTSAWDSGFNGRITLTNPTAAAIKGWTLKFKFNGNATISGGVWGAGGSVSRASDGTYTILPNTWGGDTIPAGGSITVDYGGSGTYGGVNTCTLNGAPCDGATSAGDTTAPTVSVTATPTTVTAAGAVTLAATASDNVGITKVEFYRGSTLIATDTAAPFSASDNVTSAQNGTQTYTAKAFDAAGNTKSASTNVTVNIPSSGDTTAPTVSVTASPTSVTAAGTVSLSATASDNVGVTKVEFYRGTTLLSTDTTSPFTASDSVTGANNGTVTYTAKAFDAAGNNKSASANVTVSIQTNPGTGTLPRHALIGYWHNFDNGSGYIRMKDVNPAWDIINLSFAENKPSGAEGEVSFDLCAASCGANAESEADFIAGIRAQQAKGKKVLISLGGANAHIQLNTVTARDNFVRTMGDIIARYGLDGLDIDLEGGSMALNSGDTDLNNPTTPAVVNMISAVKSLKARFGTNFILTMAPETAYVQGGYSSYGGIWGAYLPLIHKLRAELTVLHVQHYNTGSLVGTDGRTYTPGTADFHVAMTDMLLTGFALGGNAQKVFPGLRADQVAIGLPSGTRSASSGYTAPADVQRALNCLTRATDCGAYRPSATYPALRGLMSWSINWDRADNFNFSGAHRTFLNNLP